MSAATVSAYTASRYNSHGTSYKSYTNKAPTCIYPSDDS